MTITFKLDSNYTQTQLYKVFDGNHLIGYMTKNSDGWYGCPLKEIDSNIFQGPYTTRKKCGTFLRKSK